jgi:hypothetical protein
VAYSNKTAPINPSINPNINALENAKPLWLNLNL